MPYVKKTKKRGKQGEGGGRPPKYTPAVIEGYADKLIEWYRTNSEHIWLKAFAVDHDIPSDVLSEWAGKNEKFALALKKAKDIQELRLIDLGIELSRDKNKPAFVIFALKNVAGWRDAHDITSGGEKITDVKVTIVGSAK